jgi:hypothetical protein
LLIGINEPLFCTQGDTHESTLENWARWHR